jgi:hypothetical protein
MTLPTDTFVTYDAIGNREDLSDVIYMISPTETPFMSGASRAKASAVLHEWQTDALRNPSTSNAVLEGSDAVTDAVTPTVRLGNIAQISDIVYRVSGTQEAVNKAGRDSELDYQKMKAGRELKRDMESILLMNQAKDAADDSNPRKLSSVLSWIKTNTNKGGGSGADPATSGTNTRTDGDQRDFTESLLKDVLQKCWTEGGEPDTIMLGGHNKQRMSTFTGRSTPLEEAKSKKIVNSVDFYEGDFGVQKVVANRFMRSRDCLVLEMDKWAVAYLPGRKMVNKKLAVTGDSERFQLLSEYTLESRNEKASGGIFDLTTS